MGAEDGADVVAANLAIAMAQLGRQTLLVDANLRRPRQHEFFGLKPAAGLSDLLQNRDVDIEAVLPVAAVGDALRAHGSRRWLLAFLDVGGRPDRMEDLVETEARIDVARKFVGLGDDRFESRADERVAVRLAAGQRARIAAKEWQVRSKFLA